MAARSVLVVVEGSHKAEIVKKAFFGPVTPEVPASILQFHPDAPSSSIRQRVRCASKGRLGSDGRGIRVRRHRHQRRALRGCRPAGTAATAADGQVLDASDATSFRASSTCISMDAWGTTSATAPKRPSTHRAARGLVRRDGHLPGHDDLSRRRAGSHHGCRGSYEAKRDGAALVGINMEGPYISPGNIGAQNPAYLHLPDEAMFRRLQERSGNLIKLVDVAPEVDARSISSARCRPTCACPSRIRSRLRYRVRGHRSRRSAR